MKAAAELPLAGAGGEPVDFARTIVSHGVAELPPNRVDLAGRTLETTLPVRRGARTVRLTDGNGMKTICTPIQRRCDDLSGCRDAITITNERKERYEASTGRVHGGVARGA